ncbi:MAG: BrnA antitoxin family protein [Oscillospiraceae bacterium]|nr:BrnA antitoxin family protein [Oscillospiraceae bacterium]
MGQLSGIPAKLYNAKFKYFNIKPKKEPITFRLDVDLIAVMKGTGKGYQKKSMKFSETTSWINL